jgi:DnaK suppressor protein
VDQLTSARDEALQRIAALTAAREELMAATEGSNADDEHDPEGATLAFEREQLTALLVQARASLAAAEAALRRHADGSYGLCTTCGAPIGSERLEARPTATTCITCARATGPRTSSTRPGSPTR